MKKTLKGPGGLLLLLDTDEVFPDDPGNGTPALVVAPFGRGTSTYYCARDMGTVEGRDGEVELSTDQCKWLASQGVEDEVESFLSEKGVKS